MNQSPQINELAASLAKAQGEMQAAIKDSINPFFKSKYADLGSVWDAARPVLSKNGLCIMQTTEMLGEKIVMITTLAHVSGQWVKSFLPLNPSKNDSQGIGAAITYLRRYSLSALVGVVCDNDDDGETAVGRGKAVPEKQKEEEKISANEISILSELINKLDEETLKGFMTWLKKSFNATAVIDLSKSAFEKCLVLLNAKLKYIKDQEKVA
jgi:hypothetical protein